MPKSRTTTASLMLRVLLAPTPAAPDRLTPLIEAHAGAVFAISRKPQAGGIFDALPADVRETLLHYHEAGAIGRLVRVPARDEEAAALEQMRADRDAWESVEAVRAAGAHLSFRAACVNAARRLGMPRISPRTIEKRHARHEARLAWQRAAAARLARIEREAVKIAQSYTP